MCKNGVFPRRSFPSSIFQTIFLLTITISCGEQSGPGVQSLPYTPPDNPYARSNTPNNADDLSKDSNETSAGAGDSEPTGNDSTSTDNETDTSPNGSGQSGDDSGSTDNEADPDDSAQTDENSSENDDAVDSGSTDSSTGSDVFDPAHVYVLGKTSYGGSRHALARMNSPEIGLTGFESTDYIRMIHPTSGKVLYTSGRNENGKSELREFECDKCSFRSGDDYPENPASNDTVILESECASGGISRVDVTPGGQVLYSCGDGDWWTESRKVSSDNSLWIIDWGVPIGVGFASTLARGSGNKYYLNGASVRDLPEFDDRASRPLPEGGFWLVLLNPETSLFERWRVNTDITTVPELGISYTSAQLETIYASVEEWRVLQGSVLDSEGALFVLASTKGPGSDSLVLRLSPDGSGASVVYRNSSNPSVKISGSTLITGPAVK